MGQADDVGSLGGALRTSPLSTPGEFLPAWNSPPIGRQFVLDLYDCQAPEIDDLEWVRRTMLRAAEVANATIVCDAFHRFSPYGISGVVVIAESHIAVHTWPEHGYAAIDMFSCSSPLRLDAAADYLTEAFLSLRPEKTFLERGVRIAAGPTNRPPSAVPSPALRGEA
jgi:S-adenosylmethionine decarboxylase